MKKSDFLNGRLKYHLPNPFNVLFLRRHSKTLFARGVSQRIQCLQLQEVFRSRPLEHLSQFVIHNQNVDPHLKFLNIYFDIKIIL